MLFILLKSDMFSKNTDALTALSSDPPSVVRVALRSVSTSAVASWIVVDVLPEGTPLRKP